MTAASTAVEEPLSLRENFFWTFPGNVVYAGCQWGMLVVLARLGSPEMVGQFALGLAVCAPVIIFTNLQLRTVQATDARREFRFSEYLGLRLGALSLALLAITGIVFLSGYCRETVTVILAVGVAKAIESVSDVFYGMFQQRERLDRIAKSMMIKGPLSLACFGTGVFLTRSVFWAVVALAASWLLVLVSYDMPNGVILLAASGGETRDSGFRQLPALRPRWKFETLTRLAWVSLPLGVVMLLGSLNSNIPRYIIESRLGERGLGIFAAMAYVIVAGTTVMNALWESASPRMANRFAYGDHVSFRRLILKLMGLGALLGAGGILIAAVAGRPVLSILYGPEYSLRQDVFVWLMVFAAVQYTGGVLSVAVTATRRFWVQIPINGAGVLLTLALSIVLIPRYGLRGAVWAMLLPYLLNRFVFGIALTKILRSTSLMETDAT